MNIKNIKTWVVMIGLLLQSNWANSSSLHEIKNFSQVSEHLASAGMPSAEDLNMIQKNGYRHIVNLIPGDFSEEKELAESLNMSFTQIAVDWHSPTIDNFRDFKALLDQYRGDKVFVHCQLNYRASAFSYLYELTQDGVDRDAAREKMLAIWQPDKTWSAFIDEVKTKQQ